MKRLVATLIFITTLNALASSGNVVERHEQIKGDKTFKYQISLDNNSILKASCFESKSFSSTVYNIDGSSFAKHVNIVGRNTDGSLETGTLTSKMSVSIKRDSDSGKSFCDKVDICPELATITLPLWAIPVLVGVSIRDLSRTNKNAKFLKSYLEELKIPNCE